MNKFIYILFTFIYVSSFARERLYFEHLTLNHISEEEKVWDFTLDHSGILWIGGENGLYKYIGDKVIKYHHDENDNRSLSFNKIKKLYVDSHNKLWIGSTLGLNIYDERSNSFRNFISEPKSFLSHFNGNIIDIQEDLQNKCFWILDYDHGLYRYEPKSNKIIHFKIKYTESIIFNKFILDKDHIYIGSSHGLIKFAIKSQQFDFISSEKHKINCMLKYRNSIFLGYLDGLIRYHIDKNTFENIDLKEPHVYVSSIINKDEKILIACDGAGLKLINPVTYQIENYNKYDDSQLSTDNATSLYLDKNKILWVGTYMHGVNYSSYFTNYFINISNGLNDIAQIKYPIVKALTYDGLNNLWIGTDRGGIYIKKHDRYVLFDPHLEGRMKFSTLAITDIKWHQNKLIVSTFGQGIYIYDTLSRQLNILNTSTSSLQTNNIRSVIVTEEGEYWIGTFEFGIYKLDKQGQLHHFDSGKYGYHSNYILRLVEDKYKNIWFATENGLIEYNRASNVFLKHLVVNTNRNNSSNSLNDLLYIQERDEIWIGSHGNGIMKFDIRTKSFSRIDNETLNSLNIVSSLCEDGNGNIWIGAKNGVCKFNIYSQKAETLLDEKKGIKINSITSNTGFVTREGLVLFGTNKGLIQIDPSKERRNVFSPAIIFTSIKSSRKLKKENNIDTLIVKEIPYDTIITLDYDNNDLEISFAALNYINPKGNKIKYKLNGLETIWRVAHSDPTAKYYNIPPGNYEFIVHASNNDGIWNVIGKKIKIVILPPWWKTWWFYGLLFMAILTLIYLVYHIRLSSIHKYNRMLEEEIENKTKELSESNANLKILLYKTSHDVRGPLKSLSTLAQLGLSESTDTTSQTYLTHIYNSSKKIELIVEDLLTVTNPNLGKDIKLIKNFEPLIIDTIESLNHIKGADRIKITYHISNRSKEFYTCQKSLNSIIQNLIENPIKYQDYKKTESYLKIYLDIDDNHATLTFEDNGIGIPQASQPKIFEMFYRAHNIATGSGLGLYITKVVIERLRGSIHFTSTEGQGSKFIVQIPNQPPVSD
ncbi:MAG TPA: two-component regulator propeller domain-containing protein [Cytophagales bacterium]|nr:two-component regulator propeller domain-containing protein [Cytophagales bacterium]